MIELKQSTARNLKIGPFVDATDGVTAETGLTVSQGDVLLSKNGAALTQKNDATACTHDAIGYYICPLDITDTGTLGSLQLAVAEGGACPVYHEYMIVTANYYDTKYGADYFDVNVLTQTNIDFGALQKASLNAATPAVTLAAAAVDAIWDEDATTHTTADSTGERLNAIHDMETGDMTVVGTTQTFKKQDGATTRKAFTLNSATAATSRTGV